jgi:hypothetical protein
MLFRGDGLLQLTYEDATRYGCDFDWDADKALGTPTCSRSAIAVRELCLDVCTAR